MWKDLTLEEKGRVMREAMRRKVFSLDQIKKEYDEGLVQQNTVAPSRTYAKGGHLHQTTGPIEWKDPEEILAERYGVEPTVADNTAIRVNPVVTQQMKNEYAAAKERERQQAIYEQQMSNTPVLKADTTTPEERRRYRSQAEYDQAVGRMNETAANFGRALGANYDMTPQQEADWTLNTAQTLGWMAAPEVMGLAGTGYYGLTGRPMEAAATAAMTLLPVAGKYVNRQNLNALRFNADLVNKAVNARMPYTQQEFAAPAREVVQTTEMAPYFGNMQPTMASGTNNFIPLSQRDNFVIGDIRYDMPMTGINNPSKALPIETRNRLWNEGKSMLSDYYGSDGFEKRALNAGFNEKEFKELQRELNELLDNSVFNGDISTSNGNTTIVADESVGGMPTPLIKTNPNLSEKEYLDVILHEMAHGSSATYEWDKDKFNELLGQYYPKIKKMMEYNISIQPQLKTKYKDVLKIPRDEYVSGLMESNPNLSEEQAKLLHRKIVESILYNLHPQEVRSRAIVDLLKSGDSRNSEELNRLFEPESLKSYKEKFLSVPLFMSIFAGENDKEEK